MRTTLDPTARSLLEDSRRRVPALALALTVGVLAAALAVALVIRAAWPSENDSPAAVPTPAAPTQSSTSAPADAPPGGGPMALPQSTRAVDGVPVGFPATPAGAVAAAYAYSRLATSLDAAATLRALDQVADPAAGWLTTQRTAIADGVAAQRAALGLAPVGPSSEATLTLTPAGFQFAERPRPQSATVLTLVVLSGTAVDGTRTSGSLVLRWDLRWDGDRWRAVRPHATDQHDDLIAVPLTSDAAAKGWREARGG